MSWSQDEGRSSRRRGRAVPDGELVALAARAGATADATVLDQLARGAQRRLLCWAVPAAGGTAPRPSPRRQA